MEDDQNFLISYQEERGGQAVSNGLREGGEAVAPWPREIYRIVQALPEHPTGLFPPR